MMVAMFLLIIALLLTGTYAAEDNNWKEAVRADLEAALGFPVHLHSSGPQHLYYTERDLPDESALSSALDVLDDYRHNLEREVENLLLISLNEPYVTYGANLRNAAEFITNTSRRKQLVELITGDALITSTSTRVRPRHGTVYETRGRVSTVTTYRDGRIIYQSRCVTETPPSYRTTCTTTVDRR